MKKITKEKLASLLEFICEYSILYINLNHSIAYPHTLEFTIEIQ